MVNVPGIGGYEVEPYGKASIEGSVSVPNEQAIPQETVPGISKASDRSKVSYTGIEAPKISSQHPIENNVDKKTVENVIINDADITKAPSGEGTIEDLEDRVARMVDRNNLQQHV